MLTHSQERDDQTSYPCFAKPSHVVDFLCLLLQILTDTMSSPLLSRTNFVNLLPRVTRLARSMIDSHFSGQWAIPIVKRAQCMSAIVFCSISIRSSYKLGSFDEPIGEMVYRLLRFRLEGEKPLSCQGMIDNALGEAFKLPLPIAHTNILAILRFVANADNEDDSGIVSFSLASYKLFLIRHRTFIKAVVNVIYIDVCTPFGSHDLAAGEGILHECLGRYSLLLSGGDQQSTCLLGT